ncbi:type 1 glutamine amidotransferase [Nitratireductor mangrovi]|uniref:Type 1 glutamine amidotransferase n=1 Tax=Nitratireductor mangrovi TaxID=2599600 RepID=A0A5B8L2Y5_9HYPH|nr:type 1 glutamine amidotransferase [Nitratireductor mangrovi]QDZ02334.1 type 1 glutamine amidotransferase [Nitratireductor mangrovi]
MRILVVQNLEHTGLGQIGRALEEASAEVDMLRMDAGGVLPANTDSYDGLVVLGGAQSAIADVDHPYLPALAGLMRDVALSGRAVLGVCLGSQLLARGFGAKNLLGVAKEFAWQQVELTAEGRLDPVLRAAPPAFRIFQWHDDTFTLPAGAVRLALSEAADNQAFRIGRAGYGIQFHFEADRKLVAHWNGVFSEYIAERHPEWPQRFATEAEAYGPEADRAGLAIARAWVAMV